MMIIPRNKYLIYGRLCYERKVPLHMIPTNIDKPTLP